MLPTMTDMDDQLSPQIPGHWWPPDAPVQSLWMPTPVRAAEAAISVDPALYDDGVHLALEVEGTHLNLEYRVIVAWNNAERLHELLGKMINARRTSPR
jgi:hypothetical protein